MLNYDADIYKYILKVSQEEIVSSRSSKFHKHGFWFSFFCLHLTPELHRITVQRQKVDLLQTNEAMNKIKESINCILNVRSTTVPWPSTSPTADPLHKPISYVMLCLTALQNALCLFSCFRPATEALGGRTEFINPTHHMKEKRKCREREEQDRWQKEWDDWGLKIQHFFPQEKINQIVWIDRRFLMEHLTLFCTIVQGFIA